MSGPGNIKKYLVDVRIYDAAYQNTEQIRDVVKETLDGVEHIIVEGVNIQYMYYDSEADSFDNNAEMSFLSVRFWLFVRDS
jgi:hypothetical protein